MYKVQASTYYSECHAIKVLYCEWRNKKYNFCTLHYVSPQNIVMYISTIFDLILDNMIHVYEQCT